MQSGLELPITGPQLLGPGLPKFQSLYAKLCLIAAEGTRSAAQRCNESSNRASGPWCRTGAIACVPHPEIARPSDRHRRCTRKSHPPSSRNARAYSQRGQRRCQTGLTACHPTPVLPEELEAAREGTRRAAEAGASLGAGSRRGPRQACKT